MEEIKNLILDDLKVAEEQIETLGIRLAQLKKEYEQVALNRNDLINRYNKYKQALENLEQENVINTDT